MVISNHLDQPSRQLLNTPLTSLPSMKTSLKHGILQLRTDITNSSSSTTPKRLKPNHSTVASISITNASMTTDATGTIVLDQRFATHSEPMTLTTTLTERASKSNHTSMKKELIISEIG